MESADIDIVTGRVKKNSFTLQDMEKAERMHRLSIRDGLRRPNRKITRQSVFNRHSTKDQIIFPWSTREGESNLDLPSISI